MNAPGQDTLQTPLTPGVPENPGRHPTPYFSSILDNAGGVSAGWGLVVWVFGEAFGGIFGHGSSWLFGSPGAALFYVVAGVLVSLPDLAWERPRLGR